MLENVKFTAKPPIRLPWNYQNWQIFFDKESKSEEKTKFRKTAKYNVRELAAYGNVWRHYEGPRYLLKQS